MLRAGRPEYHHPMQTVADLRTHADQTLFEGDYLGALQGYGILLQLQPLSMDVRLRAADTLLALGQVQRAAVVYTALARFAAHGGHPWRALVALKLLSQLEPQLGVLMKQVAELYASGSPRLGRGSRLAPPDASQALPEGFGLPPIADPEQLAERVTAMAAAVEELGVTYPEKLPPIPVFSDLPAEEFARLLSAFTLRRVRAGAELIAEGEPGRSLFVLARGRVRVSKHSPGGEKTHLATLHEGAVLGEMALLGDAPRTASVVADTDCDLLELHREAAELTTPLREALERFAQQRLVNNLLLTAPLFRPLDASQRADLMRRFQPLEADPGSSLIRQGEPGTGLFLVMHGAVEVRRQQDGGALTLASLQPGDVFGEISLLQEQPTNASVVATQPTTVLFLARDYFQRLMAGVPEIREYVEGLGEERLIDTHRRLAEEPVEVEVELDDEALLI